MRRIANRRRQKAGMLWAWAMPVLAGCTAVGGGGGGGAAPPGGSNGTTVNGINADAGAGQQTVTLISSQLAAVTLDGTGSTSANGAIVEYAWAQRNCGQIASGPTPVILLGAGQHEITLTVTDSTGALDSATVKIDVIDQRPSTVTLTSSVQGSGTVDPASASFDLNATTTVTATPQAGWQFVRWTGASDATTASLDLIMEGDKSLSAVFEQIANGGPQRLHLPWAAHEIRTTGQANDGTFSHQDRFAWDYSVDIGTPILAVGPGRVIRVINDVPNNQPGDTPSADDPANAIQIDHGNGLQSLYAHLDQFGVAVIAGQRVVAGQFLGSSGNSGFTTGPHVHYEILDPSGNSVSTAFLEALGDGISGEGDVVTSQNALDPASFDEFTESTLPVDAFSENNIELTEPTPPAFFFTTGVTYHIQGKVTDRANTVCVALVLPPGSDCDSPSECTVFCEPHLVNLQDEFDFDFVFPDDLTGNFLLGVVGGDSGLAPVTVLLGPPDSANNRPTVSAQQPANNVIAFGDTATLTGSAIDPDGDALTYVWSQTAGPTTIIDDPTSPTTTFTLQGGKGTVQVRFQLTAFDGGLVSIPAGVEYRIQDNFQVVQAGVTDQACTDLDACSAVSGGPLSAEQRSVTLWVNLLNSVEGDVNSFEIRNPAGESVLTGQLCDPLDEGFQQVFLRFSWTANNLQAQAGNWQAVYSRNGLQESATPFTLEP